jgi:methyl-accepting chemotaxis protein
MLLRQLNIAPRAALGFALIAVLVALLGVFALGQMSSIRDSEVAVESAGCRAFAAVTKFAS